MQYANKIFGEVREEAQKNSKGSSLPSAAHPVAWKFPNTDWSKVNVDAGVLGEIGSGIGLEVRDSALWGCAAHQFVERWEPNIAEAKAIFWGLKVSMELGLQKVEMECDCLQIIQAIRTNAKGSSNMFLIIDDIVDLCRNFIEVRWSFVKRSGNKVAHTLAHLQPWEIGQRVWVEDFPLDIMIVAASNLLI